MDKTQIADQIMSIVNQMAEKLGVAAEKVYPVLIKQAYVEGYSNVLWIVIVSLLVSIILFCIWKITLKEYKESKDSDAIFFGSMCGVIVIGIGLLFIPSIKDTITAFVNPDWYVFNTLLKDLVN